MLDDLSSSSREQRALGAAPAEGRVDHGSGSTRIGVASA
jgi:hypothetical protein